VEETVSKFSVADSVANSVRTADTDKARQDDLVGVGSLNYT